MRSGAKKAGFSALETLLAVVLLGVLLGGLGLATQRATSLFRASSASGEINARAARAMDLLVREFLKAGRGSLSPEPTPPLGASTVDYQDASDYAAGAIVWGTPKRITWEMSPGELDNGIDDDGNGLVDEGSVVRIDDPGAADEQRVVLVNGVAEYLEGETASGVDDNGNGLIDERGVSFDLVDDTLTIRLTLQRVGSEGQLLVRTQEASLVFRN